MSSITDVVADLRGVLQRIATADQHVRATSTEWGRASADYVAVLRGSGPVEQTVAALAQSAAERLDEATALLGRCTDRINAIIRHYEGMPDAAAAGEARASSEPSSYRNPHGDRYPQEAAAMAAALPKRVVPHRGEREAHVVTLAAARLDRIRQENAADLATLRELPDLADLLRSGTRADGELTAVVWWLRTEADEDSHPVLVVGVRGDVGFLHWYGDRTERQVPAGVEYVDGDVRYEHGGYPHGCNPGEEIPVDQVLAAAAQFVATGRRPTCVEWIDEADVPNRAIPRSLADDPVYQAIRAAVDGD